MSEEIEVAPPESGELVVRMNGEVLPALRGPGRPPTIRQPEPSFREKMRRFVASQVELSDEQFDQVWQRYQELRKTCAAEQLPDFFRFRCPGCSGKQAGHADNCTGINQIVEVFWPPAVTQHVADRLQLKFNCDSHPAYAAKRKLKLWNTEAGQAERKKELATAVEWLHEHDCGDPETWVTREHLLHFVGLAGIVGVPKVFDAEIEADLAAALAAK